MLNAKVIDNQVFLLTKGVCPATSKNHNLLDGKSCLFIESTANIKPDCAWIYLVWSFPIKIPSTISYKANPV
jgi:hypothetical protein